MEKRMLAASPLKPFVWKTFNLSMTFSLWTFQWSKFQVLLTSLTRSTLRLIFLVKCHPNALFSSIQRYSKDPVSHLWEFSIHKPTSSPLKLSSVHNIILPPIQYKKGFFQRRSITSLRTNSVKENFYKHKRDFEQRLCNRGYPAALVHKILTEVKFSDRTGALRNKTKKKK